MALLEQVSTRIEQLVTITRIATGDTLNDLSQRTVGDLHQRMQMIRHPAERMNSTNESRDYVSDEIIEYTSVGRSAE